MSCHLRVGRGSMWVGGENVIWQGRGHDEQKSRYSDFCVTDLPTKGLALLQSRLASASDKKSFEKVFYLPTYLHSYRQTYLRSQHYKVA